MKHNPGANDGINDDTRAFVDVVVVVVAREARTHCEAASTPQVRLRCSQAIAADDSNANYRVEVVEEVLMLTDKDTRISMAQLTVLQGREL